MHIGEKFIRNFKPPCKAVVAAPEDGRTPSIHLQCLLDQLLKVRKDGGVCDDVGCASGAGGGFERFLGFIREGDDGDVCGGFVRAQLRDGFTDVAAFGSEVGEDEHRAGFGGVRGELGWVRNGLHAILEVLEAVDQLRAGHQIFVKN